MSFNRLLVIMAIGLAFMIISQTAINTITDNPLHWQGRLLNMVWGEAHRPFVNRTLIAQLLKGLVYLTPTGDSTQLLLVYYPILDSLILALWLVTFRWFNRLFQPELSSETLDFISLIALVGLWPLIPGHQMYDFPALLFATVLYGLLYQQRLPLFTGVYALALLNKETFVLFIIPAAWWLKRYDWPVLWLIMFGLSRFILYLAFGQNEGSTVQFNLGYQLYGYLTEPHATFIVMVPLGYLLYRIYQRWAVSPLFLRGQFATLAPMFLALQIFFGMPNEVRVFLEIYPLAILLAVPSSTCPSTVYSPYQSLS